MSLDSNARNTVDLSLSPGTRGARPSREGGAPRRPNFNYLWLGFKSCINCLARPVVLGFMLLAASAASLASAAAPCRIEVVDKTCGWTVPLVELQTLHGVRFVTDNA